MKPYNNFAPDETKKGNNSFGSFRFSRLFRLTVAALPCLVTSDIRVEVIRTERPHTESKSLNDWLKATAVLLVWSLSRQ